MRTIGSSFNYVLKDGWIYFTDRDGNLRKMKIDSSGIMNLGSHYDSVDGISMEKDWIYYSSGKKLYRVHIDGTKAVEIYEASKFIHEAAAVYDGWIYYTFQYYREVWRNELWKIRVDGTGNQRLLEDFNVKFMNIFNGWLYYYEVEGVCAHPYRIRLDETGKQEISIEMLQHEIAGMKKLQL